jgi:hypothetical protein
MTCHISKLFFALLSKQLRPASLALSLMILASYPPRADYTTSVDPVVEFQTFQGWGTSLAWCAHVIGGWS